MGPRIRTILAALAGLACAGPAPRASAAPAPAPAPARPSADTAATAALRRAVAFHRGAKDMRIRFRAETLNPATEEWEKFEGKLLMAGDAFSLEIPDGRFVSDGTTFWEYHPRNRQVLVKDASALRAGAAPAQVLFRFLDSEPLSLERARVEGRECLKLRLDPARAMKNLTSLTVYLDPKDYAPLRVEDTDAAGGEARYTLLEIRRDAGIPASAFRFVPPKGAEVVDMR